MKQHITKEQWNELKDKDKRLMYNWNTDNTGNHFKALIYISFTVGQLIDFLGDNFEELTFNEVEGGEKMWFVSMEDFRSAGYKDPINALWKAVKRKLIS